MGVCCVVSEGTAGAAHPSVNADFQVCQRSDVNFEKQAPLNFAGLDCSPPYHHLLLFSRVFVLCLEKLGGVCEPDIC